MIEEKHKSTTTGPTTKATTLTRGGANKPDLRKLSDPDAVTMKDWTLDLGVGPTLKTKSFFCIC